MDPHNYIASVEKDDVRVEVGSEDGMVKAREGEDRDEGSSVREVES